mgnify:CR=1 FL=1
MLLRVEICVSPLHLLGPLRYEVRDHNSQVIDVQNSIHVRILQVERALHLMDSIGQPKESGESQLGDVVQTFRPIPLENVPIPFT